ncbi:hypothetical protein HY970_01660 [Candidatus Kaiserbacteria bacterium]|nr:hypothetical protein [Candidatus Kaiserbacteria bacterium]
MPRTLQVFRILQSFRRPHDYQSVGNRGTVVNWDRAMRINDNTGLLFSGDDLLVISRSDGNPVGRLMHCRTLGGNAFGEMEAPSNAQFTRLRDAGLLFTLER